MHRFLILNIILFTAVNLFAQSAKEIGFPLIKNYSPKEYGAASQNWAITQDKRGIMYFGNVGALEYDGFDWRIDPLPNNSTVRSLAIDENGRIYVGGVGDFGYFQSDSLGENKFVSLLKFAPKENRNIADVWSAYVNGDDVYFFTFTYVFRWSAKSKKMKVWKADEAFHVASIVNGNYYVREWGKGLLKLENDSLKLVPGGGQFADERIYVMLAMPDNPKNILIVTRTKGLFLFDGKKFEPFKTEADEFIKKNLIYSGIVLSDGNIALGTLTGGLVIINTKGKILNIYDTKSGLSGNTIYYVYQDHAGTIWAAQDGGISKIDYGSSATYFDARKGLTQVPYDAKRYKGILYAATNSGIYYLNPKTSLFEIVKNTPVTQCFALTIFNNRLIAGTNEGVYEIKNNRMFPIRKSVNKDYEVSVLLPSKINPNRLFVGIKGIGSLLLKNGKWIDEGSLLKFNGNAFGIAETREGDLWVGNTVNGINRIKFLRDNNGKIIIKEPVVEYFDESNGFPTGGSVVLKVFDKIYFGSQQGIYSFNEDKKYFYRDDSTFSFVRLKNNNYGAFYAFEDSSKRVWAWSGLEPVLGIPQKDGKYNWVIKPFKRFSDESIQNIYPDVDNNVVWFFTNQSLIRYDLKMDGGKATKYDAFIRNVSIGADSVIYNGGLIKQNFIPKIDFDNNSVKFRFSAASYENEQGNKFKLYLEGFDKDWSGWSDEHIKEYTNLSPGKYNFRIKAKNILSVESNEAKYSFIILAPWYRTWWAYAFYILCFGLLVFGVDRFQRRRVTLKERQRSRLRETELRAQAAEAKTKVLQAENERKKNVELLSEIGKEITASLDLDIIFNKLYDNVNQLADATIFGVGIYHHEKEEIEYRLAIEKGKRYPVYSRDMKDKNQFPVWCILNRKPVFINDVSVEYKNYIDYYKEPEKYLEDGTKSEEPKSLIYLPLISQERLLGIITIQSFNKNAYTDYHLNILRNLATYTAIAIDNADAYRQLNETVTKLDNAIKDLKSTQEKLVVQQKLASLGQLTAGIAHEIKNPLNFVNNFAEVSIELVTELKEEISKFKDIIPSNVVNDIADTLKDLEENSNRINQHGKRADSIVKSMLQHSRGRTGEKFDADINAILEEDINLAYHGMRARDSSFNITIEKKFDENLSKISVVPQDISRVFLNIIQNGFYETNKKKIQNGNSYSPKILIQTIDDDNYIKVKIRDNGNGIPVDARDKLFEPFFTTKPSGEGTGLGLSLSYDIIVKQHRGDIKFETEEGKFTEFIISLPKNGEG